MRRLWVRFGIDLDSFFKFAVIFMGSPFFRQRIGRISPQTEFLRSVRQDYSCICWSKKMTTRLGVSA